MFDARDLRCLGPTADRNEYVLGGVAAAANLDGVRVDNDAAAVDDLDTAALQHIDVDLAETADLLVFGFDQSGPIEARHRHCPSEPGRIGKGISELRAIDEEFLRHAATQHASATDAKFLTDCHAGAVASGPSRAGDTAGTGANCKHIEIIARHRG